MKAPLFVLAVLALIFVACGAPQPQPAQQADQAIVYATPKPAVASGYDWTVERAQDILEGYGFTLEGTDYRGTSDCNVQACMGYFKGSAPVMVHVQLFIERDTLQGIVAAAWNSPSDSMLESLGFAAYDILAGPLGASDYAVDCAIGLDIGESLECGDIRMATELSDDGDGWMSIYYNTTR